MPKRAFFTIVVLVLCLFHFQALAKDLEALYEDFSPLEALVISVEAQEVILDKGREDGVHPGDIFTVYKQGKKIIHPVTKKVVGYKKTPIAKVEVRHLEGNFSTALILERKEEIKIGAPATRFTDIKALFLELVPGVEAQVLPYLKTKLPDITFVSRPGLRFQNLSPQYLAQEGFDLVFVADQRNLRVYNARLEILQIYGLGTLVSPAPQAYSPTSAPAAQAPSAAQATTPAAPVAPTSASPPAAPSSAAPAPQAPQAQNQRYPYTTLSFQRPAAPSFRRVGKLREVVVDFEMGDVDGDGQAEIVYLTPTTLFVTKYRAPGAWKFEYKGFGKVLNFSLGPRGWIALNIFMEREGLRSYLLRFVQDGFEVAVKDINLLLGFFDMDGDGLKETLLGQSYDDEEFYGPVVYEVRPSRKGKIIYERKIDVPLNFKLLGAAFADLDGDGKREIISQDNAHKACVYRGKKKIWCSNRRVGGSIYTVAAYSGKSPRAYQIAVPAEVDPYVIDINGDGRQELLMVANKSAHHDLIPGVPAYESGEVVVLTSTPMGYELLPLTGSFEGPLQGLAVNQGEVFVVLVKGNPFTQKGESYLLAFPLRMPEIAP